jgi:hypothetical protein
MIAEPPSAMADIKRAAIFSFQSVVTSASHVERGRGQSFIPVLKIGGEGVAEQGNRRARLLGNRNDREGKQIASGWIRWSLPMPRRFIAPMVYCTFSNLRLGDDSARPE